MKNKCSCEGGTVKRNLFTSLTIVTATSILALIGPTPALAQTVAKVEIRHESPSPKFLPLAGATLPVIIELRNSTSIEQKIRLVGARDGKLIDIAFPRGTLSTSDIPTYKLDIPAPIALLAYQFVIHQSDGSLSTTPQYIVKRPCIQTFRVEIDEKQQDASYKREIATLVSKARTLEQDTNNLDIALKLLDEIKGNLP